MRYQNLGQAIEIPLHNEKYYITALILLANKDTNEDKESNYTVTLLLTDKDTDKHWTIENDIQVTCDPKNSRMCVTENIEKLNSEGRFDEYIEKFEDDLRLQCIGIELEESERMVG